MSDPTTLSPMTLSIINDMVRERLTRVHLAIKPLEFRQIYIDAWAARTVEIKYRTGRYAVFEVGGPVSEHATFDEAVDAANHIWQRRICIDFLTMSDRSAE